MPVMSLLEEKISIKWSKILYDKNSKDDDIETILKKRFEDLSVLEKNLDDLYDPYLLSDMDKAVERIKLAHQNKEKVMIFGDYDVDGVTSTSLLMHLLTHLWIQVSYRLPHRVHDGYGLKHKFIDEFEQIWVDLVITVDCGSRDAEIVTYAKNKWIDIIVTDHHHVPKDMPIDAIAFINPTRPDCSYPFKWLAWAWVAYKLVMAIAREYMPDHKYIQYLKESIDIAAIGTVADCMQLVGENRIIVTEWLRQLKNSRSKGIRQLIEDKIHEDLDADVFGFLIWPRLNAAWRMDTPYKAVNLILNNGKTLPETLREIESLNELRKSKTQEFVEYALQDVNPENNIIFYHSEDIEHGIIGIVAGRLTEKYYKPSIVLIDEWNKLVASCRSPEYFSIVEILEKYKEYFIAFWWHKQAAGFSISKEMFSEFQEKITTELNSLDFSKHVRELHIDKCIKLDEIGFKFLEKVNKFKPFGMGNPKPLFLIDNYESEGVQFLWRWRDHLKFISRYGFKICAFWMWEYYEQLKNKEQFWIICELAEDHWQGNKSIMIRVVDIIL